MKIAALDHLVLTVRDIDETIAFYTRVLGMDCVTFGKNRRALAFGSQKINLHPAAAPIQPHAAAPTPGSADICLLIEEPIARALDHFRTLKIAVEGPVARSGAAGEIESVYLRDPDGNLIEIATYETTNQPSNHELTGR